MPTRPPEATAAGATEAASDLRFNLEAARLFRECARALREQRANPFRANAYARAAETLETLDVDARAILARKGPDGLVELPAIGSGLAAAIDEIARTGRLSRLERLRGAADPVALLMTVPGLGPELARRIHDDLHVDTLEALEIAAHDGRLGTLPGLGPRRVAGVRAALAGMLGRGAGWRGSAPRGEPGVDLLLDVDREYRERTAAGELPLVAPRRFNPEGDAWLPVLHARRGDWHFTALFSNTARAHELGRTRDWVVIYFHDDRHGDGQRTVVTETQGPLRGRRTVRGRETACRAHYGL